MYSQDLSSVVLDLGSLSIRAGYAGQDTPCHVLPSWVGLVDSQMEVEGAERQSKYLTGDGSLNLQRQNVQLRPTYQQGKVLDFDLYENLIRNVLTNEMRFNFQEFSFLLAEDNLHNRVQRERIAQIFYETFDVKNLFFSKNAVLSCFATGRSTALVLDSGATLSEATTVHDGYALGKSNKRCNFGGEALTNELGRYIEEELNVQLGLRNGRASYAAYHRQQLLRTIKEAVYKTEENSQPNELGQPQTTVDFELPDRQTIKIDKSRLPDPFFSSYGQDIAYRGLHHLLNDNINLCDIDIKKELYNNVIVTGGNSLLGGFVPRLQQKLAEVVTPQKCKLISFPFPIERRFSAWIGGSILASLSSFQGFWVGKQEWTEFGPSILEKKCA